MIDPAMMGGGGPPQSISLPGDSGAPSGGGSQNPEELVKQANELIRQALAIEPDEEDKLLLEKLTTSCQQYVASQQKLIDTATGAGPGAKLVRKASGSQQPQGY